MITPRVVVSRASRTCADQHCPNRTYRTVTLWWSSRHATCMELPPEIFNFPFDLPSSKVHSKRVEPNPLWNSETAIGLAKQATDPKEPPSQPSPPRERPHRLPAQATQTRGITTAHAPEVRTGAVRVRRNAIDSASQQQPAMTVERDSTSETFS